MAITKLRLAYHVHEHVAALSAFYEKALGFEYLFQDADRWLEMKAGETRFALASPAEAPEGARGPVLVFDSDDLDADAEAIRRHGGEVTARRDMGAHGRTLTARDPSGTVFQLFSRPQTRLPS